MIVTAKVLAIFFGLATIAFCVSTIVLAVQKSNLEDDLQEARNKLNALNAETTTTTWTTTTSTGTTLTSMTDTTLSPTSTTSSTPTSIPPSTPTSIPTSTPTSTSTSTTATTSTTPVNPNQTTEFPYPTLTIPTTTTTLAPGFKDPEKIVYRLPTDLRPIKYRLHFHPDLKTQTSENTVSVQVEVENVTNLIVMHAMDMEIDGISILNMMLRMRVNIKRYFLSTRELLIIELNELLRKATPYVISISYRNKLNGLEGIYASSYIDENGENK